MSDDLDATVAVAVEAVRLHAATVALLEEQHARMRHAVAGALVEFLRRQPDIWLEVAARMDGAGGARG